MKHTTSMAALFFATSLTTACSTKPDSAVEQERDEVKEQTREAAQALLDYAYARKAEFVAGMQLELDRTQAEIDRLDAELEDSKAEANADAKARLGKVREKWAKAQARLEAAKDTTESDWDTVKGDFKEAYGDMQDDFSETRQWLSDEIEP